MTRTRQSLWAYLTNGVSSATQKTKTASACRLPEMLEILHSIQFINSRYFRIIFRAVILSWIIVSTHHLPVARSEVRRPCRAVGPPMVETPAAPFFLSC